MSENGDASANPQGGNAGQPQEGKSDPKPQEGAGTANQSPNESLDAARLLTDLKDKTSEAANLRKRLKAYEDAEEASKQAAMSEVEKAQKALTDAQAIIAKKDAIIASQAVQLEAAAAHFNNPAHVAKLIGEQLEYGDDGAPTNVRALLDALGKSDPYLKASEPTQPQPPRAAMSATNAGRSAGANTGALTWDAIGKMTPQEYETRRAEIQQFMLKNPLTR